MDKHCYLSFFTRRTERTTRRLPRMETRMMKQMERVISRADTCILYTLQIRIIHKQINKQVFLPENYFLSKPPRTAVVICM